MSSQRITRGSRLLVAGLLALALVVAATAGLAWRAGSGGSGGTTAEAAAGTHADHDAADHDSDGDHDSADGDAEGNGGEDGDRGEDGDEESLSQNLADHPSLSHRQQPLAYVKEKLEKGGEASAEVLNGPAQEAYAERALPRSVIGDAQQHTAQTAGAQAAVRGRSAAGHTLVAHAQGLAAVQGWTPVGPDGGLQVKEATYTGKAAYVSGRTTALATGDTCTTSACTLFVGTAGGGLWRTDDALADFPTWTSIGHDIPSTAIGSITRTSDGTLYVGTGEPNGSSDNEAGLGLYRSTDDGATFAKVSTFRAGSDFTVGRAVASVAVDPADPQHVLVGTMVARHGASSVNGGRFTPPGAAKIGLYETRDGGATWNLALSEDSDTVDPASPNGSDFFRGGISKIVFDPTHPGVVYASMFDYGLFRASTAGGRWQQIYTIKTPGAAATSSTNRVEFATATLPSGATRIYLGDATYYDNSVAGFLRTDDAATGTPSWTELSNPTEGTPGYGSYNFCETQCSYDMVVASPPGQPDQVFLSGSMNYDELQAFGGPGDSNGRAVVRSTDAGVHVTDMTNDASQDGLHPDQHALVFAPTSDGTQTFFTGSDGGVVRQSGPYVDHSSDCAARGLSGVQLTDCQQFLSAIPTLNNTGMNKGLQTLQFQSVSVGRGGQVQGGTQDNGTWESDQQGFAETVGGDGGQSGFNAKNDAVRFHSYYDPQHDVSFDSGSPTSWDWISDPLLGSGEAASFYTPLTVDPVKAGTVFDGLQHIWRTTDNGGKRKYLDQHCNELTGDFAATCGDWVPLGGGNGNLSGGNPSNYVVAVERSTKDTSTLWAGTRLGRIYYSTNADAADPKAVTYTRLDQKLGLPQRFPSGIAIDPKNPGHVFISYSGYSAYSQGGHVYEVTVNLATGKATATDLSSDLGDQPVTDVVYVPSTNALFASTDFGVLTRTLGSPSSSWVATPGLPPVAVYGLTYDQRKGVLYAATHGRSVWKLPVG